MEAPSQSSEEPPPTRNGSPKSLGGGFTLVEVVMAISILTLLAVSTIISLVPVSRQNRMSRETEQAVAQVRNVLEQIQATPFSDLPTLYADGQVLSIPNLENGQILIEYGDPATDPLVIQATLSWDSEDMGTVTRTFFSP